MKFRTVFLSTVIAYIFLQGQVQCMQEAQNENAMLDVVNQHTQQFIDVNERIANLTQQLHNLVDNYTNLVIFTNALNPIGAIMEYFGTAIPPNNWLECDGRAISRTNYADLLQAIGITYGLGDGLNTFNIPDRRGRVAVGIDSNNSTGGRVTNTTAPNIALGQTFGEERHGLTSQEIPDHTHVITHNSNAGNQGTAPFSDHYGGHLYMGKMCGNHPAAQGQEEGTQPHNNMPPSIFVRHYIRAK